MPSWRDVLKIHPACELFPLMSQAELKELGEDIKKNGLVEPIKVFHTKAHDPEDDGEFILVDGRNRLDAMELAGMKIDVQGNVYRSDHFEVRSFDNDEEVGAFVISANVRRRHLTAEQKRDIIANVLKTQPASSDRTIAKLTTVSDKTVGAVRRELERRAEIPHVETRTDTKGRQQPIHKPKAVSVKPPPPPTAAQRVEEKIRQAGIADKKKHGDLSLARVMDEVVTTADRAELIALANHHAPERHVRARAECEKKGIDWDPTSSAEQTAGERKALYAHEGVTLEIDDDLPALPEPNVGEKMPRRYVAPLDQVLANMLWIFESHIELLVSRMRTEGRLPELFHRVRKLIDKLEAESAAEEIALQEDGANVGEAAE
jgi:ParB-like chromosome segregation protein Spo0J